MRPVWPCWVSVSSLLVLLTVVGVFCLLWAELCARTSSALGLFACASLQFLPHLPLAPAGVQVGRWGVPPLCGASVRFASTLLVVPVPSGLFPGVVIGDFFCCAPSTLDYVPSLFLDVLPRLFACGFASCVVLWRPCFTGCCWLSGCCRPACMLYTSLLALGSSDPRPFWVGVLFSCLFSVGS